MAPLLEREPHLGAIDELLAAARSASGGGLRFVGAPGLGKTALLDEAAARAGACGMRVLRARGEELESGFAWGVVVQLFGALARADHPALGSGPAALARRLFEEADGGAGEGDALFPLLHGLHWLSADLADESPLALVIDDAQDCDAESVRFLAYLLPRLEGVRIAVVLAMRPATPAQNVAAGMLDRLRDEPAVATWELRPLSPEAVGALARDQLGASGPAFRDALVAASAGNPLFCHELLDEIRAARLQPNEHAVEALGALRPKALRRSILARLRRVGGRAEELARALTVLGPHADRALAASLSGLSAHEVDATALAMADAGLLALDADLRFSHPLVDEVIRDQLSPRDLRRAHTAAARLLAEAGAAPERVAAHLLAGEPTREPWATRSLLSAARHALGRSAPVHAVQLLRRVVDLIPAGVERAEILLALGRAEASAGEAGAAQRFREALRFLPREPASARVVLEIAESLYEGGHFGEAAEAFALGLDLLGELPAGEPDQVIEARLLAGLNTACLLGTGAHPARVASRLAELTERDDAADPGLADRVLLAMAAGEQALGVDVPRDRVLALAERALAGLPSAAPLGRAVLEPLTAALVFCDAQDRAIEILDEVIAAARAEGNLAAFVSLQMIRANAALTQGQLANAAAEATESVRVAVEMPSASTQAVAPARYVLARALLERGDLEGASVAVDVPGAEQRWGASPLFGWFCDALGRVSLAHGDPAAALAAFRAAGERFAAAGGSGAFCDWRSGAALAALALGEHEEALRLAAEEERLTMAFGAPRAISIALRARARLIDDAGEAIELLERARETVGDCPAALERAHVEYELGAALRRSGRRRDSRGHLRAALEGARRCGALPLVSRAVAELEASGARRPQLPLSGPEALTPSELRVARMAADGMSNREIAQALFVTRKTVEVHLTSAYRKLDIGGRRQLAAALARS